VLTIPTPRPWRRAGGFTYFTVLILVASMGVGLAAIGTVWRQAAQRDKEQELLFVGGEFRRAIGSYFEQSPGAPQYPRNLEDLLTDKRLPVVRRHLRKLYYDPMTGSRDWGLVREPGGGILGVYSRGTNRPLKVAKFREEDKGFATALTYADWKFVYGAGSVVGGTPAIQGAPQSLSTSTDDQTAPVPVAPPAETAATKDDSAREARRPACEAQRQKEAAACDGEGTPGAQSPDAAGCAAGVAARFNNCLDGASAPGG
jgi:type II secretory pathway pseudopilin PulG